MSALHDLTVAQLAAKLKAREVSAVEAAQHFLARSRQHADDHPGRCARHRCFGIRREHRDRRQRSH